MADLPPDTRTLNPLPLADFTTLRIGGPADRLVIAHTEEDLIEAVRQADCDAVPLLIVSGGSNMLVADEGFPGTAVVVATGGIAAQVADGGVDLRVAAGEPWDGLVAHTVSRGWSGLEMLSGIPGLAGAAPVQNIGAYGADVSLVITGIRVFDRRLNQVATFTPTECRFGYRTSVFKQEYGRYIVLSVDVRLAVDEVSSPIAYAELARHLDVDLGTRAPLADVRKAVLELRRSKGMVLNEADHDTWSAGSFFTNPIVDAAAAAALPGDAPRFPQPDGTVKTSAAWLIDHAGFHKGYGTGPAALSTKHVLALTNRGGATAEDILDLARTIRDGVRTLYGITLTPEPVFVGLSL